MDDHARFLLARDDRDAAAAEALRDLLLEDPLNRDAIALLGDHYERTGATTELADLLLQAGVLAQSPPFRCLQVIRQAADQSVANDLPIIVW